MRLKTCLKIIYVSRHVFQRLKTYFITVLRQFFILCIFPAMSWDIFWDICLETFFFPFWDNIEYNDSASTNNINWYRFININRMVQIYLNIKWGLCIKFWISQDMSWDMSQDIYQKYNRNDNRTVINVRIGYIMEKIISLYILFKCTN